VDVVAARTDEPVTLPAVATPTSRGPLAGRGRLVLLVVLAALAVAAVSLIAASATRLSAATERDARRTAVLSAARQQAVNFTTLDYRHLDRDLGRVLRGATGDFRKQFKAGTKDLSTLVTQNKAVSRGEVLDAGIVSDDADSARVLVVADSTVTNTADATPQKRHYRMQLDLVRSGHRWLVSDLQFVG
jgi:Mce-associated membrane protein